MTRYTLDTSDTHKYGEILLVGENGDDYITVGPKEGDEDKPNYELAHLIAAAPELYEALLEMVEQAIGCWHNHYGHEQDPNDMPMPEHIGKAHTALVKARGEA